VYMPLSSRVAICLTTNKDEAIMGGLGPADTQRLNHLMWRSSDRFLVSRPRADLNRSLATVGRKFSPADVRTTNSAAVAEG